MKVYYKSFLMEVFIVHKAKLYHLLLDSKQPHIQQIDEYKVKIEEGGSGYCGIPLLSSERTKT